MKKRGLIAMVAVFGASMAFAASLAVPWFADNAPVKADIPPTQGQTQLVFLKSNVTDTLTLSIEYFNPAGAFLGPLAPNNTFTISPLSALAFRPVQVDPDRTAVSDGAGGWVAGDDPNNQGGQEGLQGVRVPDRPRSVDAATPIPGSDDGNGNEVIDTRKNGSITIRWQGDPTDVQGVVQSFQTEFGGSSRTTSFGFLLPPGN
jgi:hypothetical protein